MIIRWIGICFATFIQGLRLDNMAVGVMMLFFWCSFVLVEVPDITGIPAFTQNSTYGYYPVWSHLFVPCLTSLFPVQSHLATIPAWELYAP